MNANVIYCSACGTVNPAEAVYCFSCGKTLQKSAALETPASGELLTDITGQLTGRRQLHGRYIIVTLLGRGGMGAVYKAEDIQFGNRLVAVKEMSQNSLPNQEAIEAANQFKQEALLLANLNHPNLPSIYDHFHENGRWYLVMDFVEGVTVEKHARSSSGNRLPLNEVLNIGIQLAKVLGYLHTRPTPIIFRDLKPLNVMITPDKNIYLIDFGIARLFKQDKARDTITYVSAGYAAPEQFGEAQTTPRSDIYSLGVTLHRLLSGNDPLSNTPFFNFKPLQAHNPAIPPALSNLVAHMLNLDPAQRSASMTIIRQELEDIQQPQQQKTMLVPPSLQPPVYYAAHTMPSQPIPSSSHRRSGFLLPLCIGGAMLLVGAIIAGVLLFNHPTSDYRSGSTASNTSTNTVAIATTPPSPTTAPVPTPTNTSMQTTIPYPSYNNAEAAINHYYEHESDFKGKNIIQSFDSLTYQQQTGPADQPQFIACAQYKFASVSSPDVTADTARHTFTFQYSGSTWTVIDMGNWNSC